MANPDISAAILRIVKHHKSLTRGLILDHFDDDNDPNNIAAEVLDGMIAAGTLAMSAGGAFIELPRGGRGVK